MYKQLGIIDSFGNLISCIKQFHQSIANTCLKIFVLAYLSLVLTGCYDPTSSYTPTPTYTYEPITVSYEELRAPISSQEPMAIKDNGKIVVYGNYLLINEPKLGVHIFDNSTPSNPIALAFLPILGVKDISIKDDLLYADNYTDLVTFDISNIQNIRLVHRLENTFPPPISSSYYDVDENEVFIIEVIQVPYGEGV